MHRVPSSNGESNQMTGVHAALEELVQILEAAGSPIRQFLRPGLSAKETRSRLAAAGLTSTPDIEAWFRFADGVDRTPLPGFHQQPAELIPGFTYSLDEAIEKHRLFQEVAAGIRKGYEYVPPRPEYQPQALPLAQFGNYRLVVDAAQQDPERQAAWEEDSPADGPLSRYVHLLIEDLGAGRYSIGRRGRWLFAGQDEPSSWRIARWVQFDLGSTSGYRLDNDLDTTVETLDRTRATEIRLVGMPDGAIEGNLRFEAKQLERIRAGLVDRGWSHDSISIERELDPNWVNLHRVFVFGYIPD